jgi:DNA invertase Pin-like site-specific DNA recombinase
LTRNTFAQVRGIKQARKEGKPHGRPMTVGKLVPEMKQLRKEGLSKWEIAKRLAGSVAPQ